MPIPTSKSDDLVISADLREVVQRLRRRGFDKYAILAQLARDDCVDSADFGDCDAAIAHN